MRPFNTPLIISDHDLQMYKKVTPMRFFGSEGIVRGQHGDANRIEEEDKK